MKISFHGAARTVTGSKHVLTLKSGKKILLDCGLFQGLGKATNDLNADFGFEPSSIDYMLLSHAHIDHSGLIPKLVKEGFTGNIYCTPGTKSLSAILLADSATIQRDDTKFVNKKRLKQGLPPVQPLYDIEDAQAAMDLFVAVDYDEWFKIDKEVSVLFTDAGHIIGSAAVNLKIKENSQFVHFTFSGDVGRYRDVILRSPEKFPQADYLVIESTYGNSLHDDVKDTVDTLHSWIVKTCVEKKGKLIIPSFSVGRTQELLYSINQLGLENRMPKVPVFVDSPLSKEATDVVKSFPQYFNNRIRKVFEIDDDPFDFPGLKFTASVDESKSINELHQPCIIISASGMADAGRIKHHIANNISDKRNTILVVGYCEPHSLGGKLRNGLKEVRIFGEDYKVVAEIGVMKSMSAHGDYDDLCTFLSCQDTKKVKSLFIVHGEYEVQEEFKDRMEKKGFAEVIIPALHETYPLS